MPGILRLNSKPQRRTKIKDYPHLLSVHGKELLNSTCLFFFCHFTYLIALFSENLKISQLSCTIWWSKNIYSDDAECISSISVGLFKTYHKLPFQK